MINGVSWLGQACGTDEAREVAESSVGSGMAGMAGKKRMEAFVVDLTSALVDILHRILRIYDHGLDPRRVGSLVHT